MSTRPMSALIPVSSTAGGSYSQTVSAIPLLTAAEEKQLAEALYYRNDLDAAQQLIMSHLRFVAYIARSYNGYGLSESDLIQEGNIGLMKAVKRFNPEKGVRLVSFAVHWIKAEIHEFILRNWRIVKIATTKAQRKLFFNLRSSKKQLGWLTNDEATAIANDLGVEMDEVRLMEGRMQAHDMSFDPYDADDEEEAYAPSQYLIDPLSDPALAFESDNWEDTCHDNLAVALEQLDARSRDILQQRWVNEKKLTLHDLADKYQVSAERIRQLEQNAMKKLRIALEAA